MRWRYLIGDSLTSQIWDEVPLDGFRFSRALNRPGGWSATIPLHSPKLQGDGAGMLTPNRTAIWAVADDVIMFGGTLATIEADIDNGQLSIGGQGLWQRYRDQLEVVSQQGMTYPTAAGTVTYLPSADVTETNVQGSPDATDLYKNVDDTTATLAAGIFSTGVGVQPQYTARMNVPGGALAGATIEAVTVVCYAAALSNSRSFGMTLQYGSDYINSPAIFWTLPRQLQRFQYSWTTNPANNQPWTPADIQAFASTNAAGWYTTASAAVWDTVVSRLYMTVTYGSGTTIYFDDIDQSLIAQDLIAHATSFDGVPPLDVNLRGPGTGGISGVTRDRQYDTFSRPSPGNLIENLAGVVDGIDFGIDWDWQNNQPHPTLHIDYPQRGRTTDLIFEVGKNVTLLKYSTDGTKQATVVAELGQGEGEDKLVATATSPNIAPLGALPRLMQTFTRSTVKEQATLNAHATADLARYSGPVETLQVGLLGTDTDSQLGAFSEGDTVGVHVDAGWLSFHGPARIQGFDVTVDTDGHTTATVDLAVNNLEDLTDE